MTTNKSLHNFKIISAIELFFAAVAVFGFISIPVTMVLRIHITEYVLYDIIAVGSFGLIFSFLFSSIALTMNGKHEFIPKNETNKVFFSHIIIALFTALCFLFIGNFYIVLVLSVLLMYVLYIFVHIKFFKKIKEAKENDTAVMPTVKRPTLGKAALWLLTAAEIILTVYGLSHIILHNLYYCGHAMIQTYIDNLNLFVHRPPFYENGVVCFLAAGIIAVTLIFINSRLNLSGTVPLYIIVISIIAYFSVPALIPSSLILSSTYIHAGLVSNLAVLFVPVLLNLIGQILQIIELIKMSRKKNSRLTSP